MPRRARVYSNPCPIGCGGYHSKRHKAYRKLRTKNIKRIFNSGMQSFAGLWKRRRAAAAVPPLNNHIRFDA